MQRRIIDTKILTVAVFHFFLKKTFCRFLFSNENKPKHVLCYGAALFRFFREICFFISDEKPCNLKKKNKNEKSARRFFI